MARRNFPQERSPAELSHIDAQGRARMVDVGEKDVTERVAVASATLVMKPATLRRIRAGSVAKGEVLAVARVAGIMAAKKTARSHPALSPAAHQRGVD